MRAAINSALSAISGQQNGNTAPTGHLPYQLWVDTGSSPAIIKIRDSADSSWRTVGTISDTGTFVAADSALLDGQNSAHYLSAANLTGDLFAVSPTGTSKRLGMVESRAYSLITGAVTPLDNTVPTISGGAQILSSGSLTPSDYANTVRVRGEVSCLSNGAAWAVLVTVFAGNTCIGVVSSPLTGTSQTVPFVTPFDFETTIAAPTTFTVRVGDPTGNNIHINGVTATYDMGSKYRSFLEVIEIKS